ncbi:MAG: hypothetical protein K2O16_14690 [Lachnospiraceae bacterium]|nr:hypothetical protein [Lachnospiraceae bacterium]
MTEEQKHTIKKCCNSGWGYGTIAKETGLTKDTVVAFCRAKKEKGITCQSHNYTEEKLQEICAGLMGTEGFDGSGFKKQIKEIVALEDGSLACHFYEGKVKKWQRT